MTTDVRDASRIGWPLRAWFGAELFFAVTASLSVGLRPQATAENFAWKIQPDVMAALIGSFYLALAPVVILALVARRWENVRVFVLPGMVFTLTQLVVTFLHWERFAVGTAPFWIWFLSYLLPPPIFLGCYLWQERRRSVASGASAVADSERLPPGLRLLLRVLGAAFSAEALVGLVLPAYFSAWAPWKITPLNARALSGYFLFLGLLLLSAARENHRDRVRVVAPFFLLLLPIAAFQVSRFSAQVDFAHPRLWVAAGLLLVVSGIGAVLVRGSWRTTLGR
jgi:hypothetical protein